MTKYYLIHSVCMIQPFLHGPYNTEEEQSDAARELHKKISEDDVIFWLDVDKEDGEPKVGSYAGRFFRG